MKSYINSIIITFIAGLAFLLNANSVHAQFATVESITPSSFSSNVTTHNVNMPPTVYAGELLLALITSDGTATVTVPSGWSQLYSGTVSSTVRVGAYYKFADGSEGGTTVNFQTSGSETMTAQVYRISGALSVQSGAYTTTTGTQPNPPSLSPSWGADSNLWIAMTGAQNGSRTISSYPSGYTGAGNVGVGTTAGANVASAYLLSYGATQDPSAFTWSGSTTAALANTIAVRPSIINFASAPGGSYDYFYVPGYLNNNTGQTLYYGIRWGAGSGYASTSCASLPNQTEYTSVNAGYNQSIQPNVTGLTGSTLYYYCLYARTGSNTYYYSSNSSFTTSAAQVPSMERTTKGEITSSTASITGNINNQNGASITAKGICYSSSNATPAVGQGGTTCTSNGTGTTAYTANISGLTANTLYYFRAYSTNSAGTGYSSTDTFTTETTPPAGYPQIVSTTGFYTRTTGTTHNVVMPATVNSGDLLLAIVANDGSATVTTPSGWTLVNSASNGTSMRLGIYYKFADGTEDGASVNFATSASEILTATVYRITGASAVETGTAATGTSTAPNPPSLTPSWGAADTLWLSAIAYENSIGFLSSHPSNYTHGRRDGDTYSNSTSWQAVASSRRYNNTATEDPGTAATSSVLWIANTIAIRPQPTTPAVTTDAASSVAQTTATINGTANPNGTASTGWFRYYTSNPGTCSDSGGTRSPSSSGTSLGSGTSGVAYNRNLTGLTPGTQYWVCAIASNSHGTAVGSPVSFTTTAGTPTSVSADGDSTTGSYFTILTASANPNNFTSYGFFRLYESDPGSCTDSGGQRYPADGTGNSDQSLGSSASSQNFDYSISSGLDPDTTYYYCAFARNQYGTVGSSVDTFTTEDGAAGACDPPTAGSHTISGSCSYTSSVGGVDAGTGTNNTAVLTIGAGRTLTINAAQQVAWGSISMQGGSSINLGSGGSLRRSPIWVIDEDADGIIDQATQVIGNQPAGGVRRNAVSNNYSYFSRILSANTESGSTALLDCDSGSEFVYRNVANMVTDADNDGYKTSASAATQCVGDSSTINGRTYYENSSGVSTWLPAASALGSGATDCDDNSAAPCPPTSISLGSPSNTQITVAWTAATGPTATSYNLQWCSGASCTPSSTISSVTSTYTHTGRTCNTVYGYRIIAVNAAGSSSPSTTEYVTTSGCSSQPSVTTTSATSITGNSALLRSTVNPNGATTSITYRYGTSNASCASLPSTVAGPSGLTGSSNLSGASTQQTLSGLNPSTTYYFCVTANNSNGTTNGSVLNFTTLGPTVTTTSATNVQVTTATIRGNYGAYGGATLGVWFRYWSSNPGSCSDSGGTRAPSSGNHASTSNTGPFSTTRDITGLSGGTTYYYCMFGSDSNGSYNSGTPTSFTTGNCGRDADGDGYGVSSQTASCGTSGYVSNYSDCYDNNANAYPGQTNYFITNRGDGSFDYNCNSSIEQTYGNVKVTGSLSNQAYYAKPSTLCAYQGTLSWTAYQNISTPTCGETFVLLNNTVSGLYLNSSCVGATTIYHSDSENTQATQSCR